jgi:hypothetical protein
VGSAPDTPASLGFAGQVAQDEEGRSLGAGLSGSHGRFTPSARDPGRNAVMEWGTSHDGGFSNPSSTPAWLPAFAAVSPLPPGRNGTWATTTMTAPGTRGLSTFAVTAELQTSSALRGHGSRHRLPSTYSLPAHRPDLRGDEALDKEPLRALARRRRRPGSRRPRPSLRW